MRYPWVLAATLLVGAGIVLDTADISANTLEDQKFIVSYVYDGDTVYGWFEGQQRRHDNKVAIRFDGYDTAELKEPQCVAEKVLAEDQRRKLRIYLPEVIMLKNIRRGKYKNTRWIARGYIAEDVSVAYQMIKWASARPYSGGRRKGWCND